MMDAILEQFLSEARDNLDYLDAHLKDLEDGDEESINALFRAAHTLKGGAGLVGLTHIKEVTHAAEDLLDAYRNKKVPYSEEMLDALYDAFDEVIELVDAVEESGEADIEVDEERINEIRTAVRSFIESTNEHEKESSIELPFTLDETISLENLNSAQLSRILPHVKSEVHIDEAFISSANPWVIDLNLSEDTIELGNDPFYLLSMFDQDDLLSVSSCVYNPDQVSDPLALKTRMWVVVVSDVENIEDVFYNVIDEITAYPLSPSVLLQTQKESIHNETYTTLLQEIANEGTEGIEQKLKAALNVINPETKEGFIVERLYEIARIDPDRLEIFLKELLPQKEATQVEESPIQNSTQTQEQSTIETPSLSQKEKETTLNILNAQKMALNAGGAFERVKFLLKNVASFLGVEKSLIDGFEDEASLLHFIEQMEQKLQGGEATPQQEVQEVSTIEKKEELSHVEKTPQPQVQAEEKPQPKPQAPKKRPAETKSHTSVPKTIKIDQEEIDALMDIVGEILVIKNSLPYIAEAMTPQNLLASKREILLKYEEISRITEGLQDRVMGMRLLPLSYIFNRYPKLVRDISKKLGKKIEYKEEGAETKLDKMMIEKLADPLVHIIRNSLDHGLESVEERKAAGKDEVGVLLISAKSQGDRVFIKIADDGRGIDVDKVVQKAMEKQLIDPSKLDSMSEEEKLGLIFLPGLSTKDEITDLSGRGVGADAVKTTVDELGGKIVVQSEKGKGTTITLELPVSVALTNLFQITMGGENYAIAMENVIETDKITKDEIQTANHKPFMRLRESIIPLVLDERLLGRSEFKDQESVLIVRVGDTQVALVADELVGQIDVVQKPLGSLLANHPYINGTSLLGNGEPLFVIKPEALVKVV